MQAIPMMAVIVLSMLSMLSHWATFSGQKRRAIRKNPRLDSFRGFAKDRKTPIRCVRGGSKRNRITQESIQRNFVPTRNLQGIHMIDHS